MIMARTIGITTASATGNVTLFESAGFSSDDEPVEPRLKRDDIFDMGISMTLLTLAG